MSEQSKRNQEDVNWERRANAEDAIVKYLAENFSPQVAAAISTTVEMLLTIRWETEFLSWSEDDPRMVFMPTESAMREITRVFTEIPRGVSDPHGEKHVFDLLQDLPLDWAWNVMRLARMYLVQQWRHSTFRQTPEPGAARANVGAA